MPLKPTAVTSHYDDFFSFDEQSGAVADAPALVETEIASYFSSGPVMENLHQFPRITKNALCCNAPTSSSAPVERLFSLESLVLTQKRIRLSDGRFQRLPLMRYNRYFSQVGVME